MECDMWQPAYLAQAMRWDPAQIQFKPRRDRVSLFSKNEENWSTISGDFLVFNTGNDRVHSPHVRYGHQIQIQAQVLSEIRFKCTELDPNEQPN